MNDYNDYVSAVNKIFDYLNKMRTGWNSQDNISHIENIEEYKRNAVMRNELKELFIKLEFLKLIERFGLDEETEE